MTEPQQTSTFDVWSFNKTFSILAGIVLILLGLQGFYTKMMGGLEVKSVYLTLYTLAGMFYLWAGVFGSRIAATWTNRILGWFFLLLVAFQIVTFPLFTTLTKSMKIHVAMGLISLFIGRYGTKIRRYGVSYLEAKNWIHGR